MGFMDLIKAGAVAVFEWGKSNPSSIVNLVLLTAFLATAMVGAKKSAFFLFISLVLKLVLGW